MSVSATYYGKISYQIFKRVKEMFDLRPSSIVPASVGAVMLLGVLVGCNSDSNSREARLEPEPVVPEIMVLSNRADLISGGDALIELVSEAEFDFGMVEIELNGTDVKGSFSLHADGRYIGLVAGFDEGENSLIVNAGGSTTREITIKNHSITGPVISGPQIMPYECRTVENNLGPALDESCSVETQVEYRYRSMDDSFKVLEDPLDRPDDMVMATTSEGDTVPYIVRVESGTINRGIYRFAVLDNPADITGTYAPGVGWNKKLIVSFGGGGGASYNQGVASEVMIDLYLSQGFAHLTSSELINNQHANPHLQAETLMMLKEHIIERIGIPKWVAGVGGSGGAIQQYMIAQLYPGLLDGLQPGISFPETLMTDVFACSLLNKVYQSDPTRWVDEKQVAIQGFNSGTCAAWDFTFAPIIKSEELNGGGPFGIAGCHVIEPENIANIFHPVSNPEGPIRCDILQTNSNLLGTDSAGRALRPLDNVGVQYGLGALNRGDITVTDFIDLNEQVGGFDGDGNFQSARHEANLDALRRAYAGGFINSFTGVAELPVPIIAQRSNADFVGDIHDTAQDLIIRARLERLSGHSDNMVIWTSSTGASGSGINLGQRSLSTMNDWLDNIAEDLDPHSMAKVVENKPVEAVDGCWDVSGVQIVEEQSADLSAECNQVYPRFTTPKIEAGESYTRDILKCQLKPVDIADYSVAFSIVEQERLKSIFPNGICDYSLSGVSQVPAETWTKWVEGEGFVPLPNL